MGTFLFPMWWKHGICEKLRCESSELPVLVGSKMYDPDPHPLVTSQPLHLRYHNYLSFQEKVAGNWIPVRLLLNTHTYAGLSMATKTISITDFTIYLHAKNLCGFCLDSFHLGKNSLYTNTYYPTPTIV